MKQPGVLALYFRISPGAEGKHRSEELKEMTKQEDRPQGEMEVEAKLLLMCEFTPGLLP